MFVPLLLPTGTFECIFLEFVRVKVISFYSKNVLKEFQASLDSGNWKQVVHKPRESKWAQGLDLNVGATIKVKMYKRIRAATEVYYQKKKANLNLPKMTTSELRLLTAKALKEAWVETFEERRVMIRAFEKTGISLKVDGSEDAEKMKFQAQEIGIPLGLDI